METVAYVSTDIVILESHSPYFFKKWLKVVIIPKYGRTGAKVGLRVAERIIIFEALQLMLALYFKMLSVVLSGLVLIRIFLRRHISIFMPSC